MWGKFVRKAKEIWSRMNSSEEDVCVFDSEVKKEPKKYKCQICNRMIEEEHAIMHIKTEEYIINLIKKDHPRWKHQDIACRECIEYYRRLVKEAEL